ncbi:uncharacterized protein C8A04DRAFT_33251 [Dichotomopilus funicola]|uniref:Ca2+ regulator and membrane fusion protein Fig1-domain-containing protein n=1 Tax=Dichotomopilus funicola TaxID=1934379 RepID=A0AAN6ZIN5_9PEZI|nr:hypothetical protein C8A04DRAFT_33251 [Dichotomopilus funicola]
MKVTDLVKLYFKPAGLLRFAPYLLVLPIVIFYCLSLTGCLSTSPAIPNIYIVDLWANNGNTNFTDTDPLVKVRVNYFGICGVDDEGTRCMATTGKSIATLTANLFPTIAGGPSNNNTKGSSHTTRAASAAPATPGKAELTDMVTTAINLQSRNFISVLAGAAVLFLFSLAGLVLLKRDSANQLNAWERTRRSVIIRRSTYGLLYGSTSLLFAAALSTTQSAGALEWAAAGMVHASVLIKSGTTLQVLQWLVFGFQAVFVLTVPILMRAPKAEEGGFKGEV